MLTQPAINSLSWPALLLALLLSTTGCKLRIDVPEGGRVVSESGVFSCEPGQTCDIDNTDFFFDETFKAVPDDGYYFRRWENGDRLLCGNSYSMECRLTTSAFEGNSALESILGSDEVFRLLASFGEGV